MGESKVRGRWLKITLLGLILIPLASFVILWAVFQLNAIPESKLQPPAELLAKIQGGTAAAAPVSEASAPGAPAPIFTEQLDPVRAAELQARILAKAASDDFKNSLKDIYPWRTGEPLSEVNLAWLATHRDLIEDLIAIARAGGFATGPTREEVMAKLLERPAPSWRETVLRPVDSSLLQHQWFVKILVAESQRRRKAGDATGAAEALLATLPLARSVSEPFLINQLIGLALNSIATGGAVKWLESDPPSPAIALQLRQAFAGAANQNDSLRRVMEIEYLNNRMGMIEALNGPMLELLKLNMGQACNSRRLQIPIVEDDESGWRTYLRLLGQAPLGTLGASASATMKTIGMKSRADGMVEDLDRYWDESFDLTTEPSPVIATSDYPRDNPMAPNLAEAVTRTRTTQARMQLLLAGLDGITGRGTPLDDPFSEMPLRVIEQPGATLFYSLGPDGVDQRAAISYDPTNGTLSPGDIFIRVRHP